MLFVYEKFIEDEIEFNFIDCMDKNGSGIRRFSRCPITSRLTRNARCGDTYKNYDTSLIECQELTPEIENYLIPTGINHSPEDWCGSPVGERKNLFDCLNEKYLNDLRNRKALLLLDQSHEGYQTPWLWKWFHESCNERNIPPSSVVYVTGNLLARKQYEEWCNEAITDRMFILPYAHFEHVIYETARNRDRLENLPLPTLDDQIAYKQANLEKIKDYNFLQKRLRNHRLWGYKAFYDADIISNGMLSMNNFDYMQTHMAGKVMTKEEVEKINHTLPQKIYDIPNNIRSDSYYITRFNDDVMLDTWISIVSEASFSDTENTCFLSEKIFKPIACFHPFIVFGNKNSLNHLRDMGYKTFHPFIDESYDKLDTWERLPAIVDAVKKFNVVSNKLEWYKELVPILKHNHQILYENSHVNMTPAIIELDQYQRGYFNVS